MPMPLISDETSHYHIGFISQMRIDSPYTAQGKGYSEALALSEKVGQCLFFCYTSKKKIWSSKVSSHLSMYAIPITLSNNFITSLLSYLLALIRMVSVILSLNAKCGIAIIRAENSVLGGLPALLTKFLSGVPFGIWLGGMEEKAIIHRFSHPVIQNVLIWIIRQLKRLIFSISEFILCISRELQINALSLGGTRVIPTPNFIDFSKFSEKRKTEPRDYQTIVYLGRLEPEKGISILRNSIQNLSTRNDWRLWLIGTGSQLNQFVSMSDPRISILGQVPHSKIPSLLSQCDILVLPSFTEGAPAAILEAMASGLAIVATNVGGIPHMITSNREGLLVDPQSTPLLSDALTTLLDNPNLVTQMGINGRRKVELLSKQYFRIQLPLYSQCNYLQK